MWGKVLPEFSRFLLSRPFGQQAPLDGLVAAQRLQQALVAQIAADPEGTGQFLKDNPGAIYAFQLLLPGSPENLPVNAPAWLRHLGRDYLEGDAIDPAKFVSTEAMDSAAKFGIGRDLRVGVEAAADIGSVFTPQKQQATLASLEDRLSAAAAAYDGQARP